MKLASYIDHTVLKATATKDDIKLLCKEAKEHSFFSVCVNSCWVSYAKKELEGSPVKVCSVIGFPLGAMSTEAKIAEAVDAVLHGADEIDMVINVGFIKSSMKTEVQNEITQIKKAIGNKVLKVIIETCYLTDEEKKLCCNLSVLSGADFVKTSTGFGSAGATYEDVQLMLDTVQDKALVKASGGVKDKETAERYVSMGVKRLGTSNGIKIISGDTVTDGY